VSKSLSSLPSLLRLAHSLPQGQDDAIPYTTGKVPSAPAYAHPWPDALPGLGRRSVGPFDPCSSSGCERWSWVRYGAVVLCLACAKSSAQVRS